MPSQLHNHQMTVLELNTHQQQQQPETEIASNEEDGAKLEPLSILGG